MRVLLTWELGDNFGHIGKLVKVAQAFRQCGDEVYLSLQNPAGVAAFYTGNDLHILPAPYGLVRGNGRRVASAAAPRPDVLTFADDVGLCGYDQPEGLYGLVQAWTGLFDLVQPDVLISNSSPTALLATQGRERLLKVALGLGYEVPPLMAPMPPLRFWMSQDLEQNARQEADVLKTINTVQRMRGLSEFSSFFEAFVVDLAFITSFPELDHYGLRSNADYVGPFFSNDTGSSVEWDAEFQARRVFAYIYPSRPNFMPMAEALRQSGHQVILVAPGVASDVANHLSSRPGMRVFSGPIQLRGLSSGADLCITHAGTSTLVQFLLAGCPHVLMPNHIEQLMVAKRMEMAGFGYLAPPVFDERQAGGLIEGALKDERLRARTQAFAAQYGGFQLDAAVSAMVEKIRARVSGKI